MEILILGIGNILLSDEGIGVRVVEEIEKLQLPPNVKCLDGGTGGFHLLGEIDSFDRVLLIDATMDGTPPGTVNRLTPKYSSEYPRTLTAHDIGLKDLLDTFYLTEKEPNVLLFTVSISSLNDISLDLTEPVKNAIPKVIELIFKEIHELSKQSALV